MSSRSRLAVRSALVAVVVAFTAACGGAPADEGPRPVTTDESQLLAISRFRNFDAGARSFSTAFSDAGFELELTGYMDYSTGVGYASLIDGGTPNSLVTWQVHTLAVHAPTDGTASLPVPGAAEGLDASWAAGPIAPESSTLHTMLVLLSELGADRPDNPLLLQQGGATFLRTDTVDGVAVTVFGGPTGTTGDVAAGATPNPSFYYWVDETGLMLRVEARLGAEWLTIEFRDATGVTLTHAVGGEAS